MRESEIQSRIRIAVAKLGAVLFRCNTGLAWTGEVTRINPTTILIKNARPFHAGLTRGGSDLIGWNSVIVTEAMVGRKIAVFSAVECKNPHGRITAEQENFLDQLNRAGGIAVIARSEDDATTGVLAWSLKTP